MTVSGLGEGTARAALELANQAPSVHNPPPWRWRVAPRGVQLYAEAGLHSVHTDPDDRDLLVSCGVALHHCVIAFAAHGWRAVVHRLPDPQEPHHLADVELHRAAPSAAEAALAGAIQRRRTVRPASAERAVGLDDIALMGARAARFGVTLRRLEPTPELRTLLPQAVWTYATAPPHVTRTRGGRHSSVLDVPAGNAPQRYPTPMYSRVATIADNGVLMALGTVNDDAVARLRAGEAASAVLLTATVRGLANGLIAEPLERVRTRNRLRELAFDDGEFPQMLVRVGWDFDG
ncbi:nitroreductase family protein [Mycolicibacterium mengxianglii]|uniref:NAD(P)H nitroreductase n=1 Tax=Mycolicibacterium mengxianglii TaxID=2736649 RepID=UPI0018EEFC26|nr:NAD(P)H nitroreductase [Mycolicibacterium mengxianglii]